MDHGTATTWEANKTTVGMTARILWHRHKHVLQWDHSYRLDNFVMRAFPSHAKSPYPLEVLFPNLIRHTKEQPAIDRIRQGSKPIQDAFKLPV